METNTQLSPLVHSFGMAVPPRKVTNDDLAQWMDTSDEWITKRTGIQTRFWVDGTVTTSDLAVQSAKQSIQQSDTQNIDAIIAATLSPDYCFPGIGTLIQDKLNLSNVPAFDLRNQCSGFLYGLELAGSLIKTGQYQHILLVGAEVHSTGLDVSTRGRDIAVLFGDGAGSCIVANPQQQPPPLSFSLLGSELHSDGSFAQELWCEHPGSVQFPERLTADLVEEGRVFPYMNGRLVFEHAVRRMTEVSQSLLRKCQVPIEKVKIFLPHQANLRINQMVGKQLGLPKEKVFNTISQYGNTTAATIPIGFHEAVAAGKIADGDYVLSAAFGSGFTWGAALLQARQS